MKKTILMMSVAMLGFAGMVDIEVRADACEECLKSDVCKNYADYKDNKCSEKAGAELMKCARGACAGMGGISDPCRKACFGDNDIPGGASP